MTGRVLAVGEEFLIAGMDSGDEFSYVTDLFRATGDLDLSALEAEFNALDWDLVTSHQVMLNSVGRGRGMPADFAEAYFQRWLVEQGHIERVPVRTLWVGQNSKVYTRPGSDTQYVGFSSLSNDLVDPVPDPEFEPAVAPRP